MKKLILYTFISLSLFLLHSCTTDLLDTQPSTSILEKDAFSSMSKIQSQVNNLYAQLQNANLYGGRWIIFNEQRADEFGQNDGNAATGSAVWNQNVASTNEYINNVWSAAYFAINNANILIENLSTTKIISDSLAQHYIAEAKFIRATAYIILIQTYAKPYNQDPNALGLPLRLTAIRTAAHNDLARSTVAEVYTQIIKDLDDAEAKLPNAYSNAILNTTRAHKSTAIAMKTRVYLNMNKFAELITEANKIVSSAAPFNYSSSGINHQLESNYSNLFSGTYTGPESIFSIAFANTNTETPAAQFALAFNYIAQPILFLSNTGIINNNSWQTTADARNNLIATNSAKQKILKKFTTTTAPFKDYVPVIRYAEVLLNLAEAAAQTGDLNRSVALLLAVKNRANPTFSFAPSEIDSKDKIINTIITERRIEFLGEGLRLQDLQRKVQNLPSKIGAIGTAPEVLPTAKNYIWPIPSGELSVNKLCLPN